MGLSTPQNYSPKCGHKNGSVFENGWPPSIIPTLQHDLSLLFAGGGLCCAPACANLLQHAVVVEKGKSTSLEYAVFFQKFRKVNKNANKL